MLSIVKFCSTQVDLWQGDVTEFACDAVVNAANTKLQGGGGVDGAIHRIGGPGILAECQALGGCPTGNAVVTGAGQLPASWVIHAVGPVWAGGKQGESELLAAAYRASFQHAERLPAPHIALPALSAGAYRFPHAEAAAIALDSIRAHLVNQGNTRIRRVSFVLFTSELYDCFRAALTETFAPRSS